MSPASGQRKRDEMLKTSCQPLDLSEILTHEGSHLNISVTDQQFPFDVGNFSWELQLSIITIRTLLNGISHPPKSSHLELTRSPHLEEGSSLGILKRNNLVLRCSRVLESKAHRRENKAVEVQTETGAALPQARRACNTRN